jgi:hypothetical protein
LRTGDNGDVASSYELVLWDSEGEEASQDEVGVSSRDSRDGSGEEEEEDDVVL